MYITESVINRILGIEESYQLPERMMQILGDKTKRERVFDEFLKINSDLSYDWFTDYFQEEHSNRKAMMQDFTPKSITDIIKGITGDFISCADICAGTGGLTIAMYNKNPDGVFYCAELSERALPLLLFNLSIRCINGWVVNQDVLTQETKAVYKLVKGERYSDIETIGVVPEFSANVVVMNPPYSVKHKWDTKVSDKRFEGYGYPPNNFCDFGFVLHGLAMLKDGGELIAILPQGVLFRGNKEGIIRKNLINQGNINALIGLPDKLFLNTAIPVFILCLKKGGCEDVLFIDASKEFKNMGKQNIMSEESIEKIKSIYLSRMEIDKFSYISNLETVEYNDFNLAISRYVDTYEPPPIPDLAESVKGLADSYKRQRELDREILFLMKGLSGTTAEVEKDLREACMIWEREIVDK